MMILVISLPIVLAEEYSLLYDANGNLIYDQETNVYREYNELNQLIRARINNATGTILQEYTWEPLQERIFIKDEFYSNGSLKSSTYYFGDDYVVIQNSSGTFNQTFIYQDGILVGYEDVDGRKRYVLPDHKGSVHLVLNESGNVIEENLFSPFAEPLQGVNINKFSYEAKEYDPLTKDYDFHFRKFSVNGPPILNQPDTLIQNVYDPQSLNRFAFERNNPYKYTDPTGHWGDPATVGIGRTIGTTIITGLTAIFAPEVVIGIGLIVVGGLVITALIQADETKEMYSTKQRGFEGKEYESKEDWLDEELPREGDYPFQDPPPKERRGKKYKYDREGNPIDKKGDSWRPDRQEKHWDVQHKGGGYTRVTPDGNILPFVAVYSTGKKEQDRSISGDIKRTGGKLDWYYSEKSKTYTWRPKGYKSPSGYKKV